MARFHPVVDKVLLMERFFAILINVAKVGFGDFCNFIQLTAYTTGSLCLLCSGGVGSILSISSSTLQ